MSTTDSLNIVEESKKQPGIFSRLILLVLLPIIYMIGLGMVLLHFAGISFQTQVKWVEDQTKPLFNSLHDKTKKEAVTSKAITKKTSTNSAKSSKKTEAESAETSKTESTPVVTTNQVESEAAAPQSSLIASALTNMDPKDAAKLVSNMPETEAIKNMKLLQTDDKTAILAEMSAEQGAVLAVALDNGYEGENMTESAAQLYQYLTPDQIASILKGISDKNEVLKQIKQLDPNIASKVVSKLDPAVSGWIVSKMD